MMLDLVERGLVPDAVTRMGIRRLLRERLSDEERAIENGREQAMARMVSRMREGPIAVEVNRANEQHYEQPAEFFRMVLGRRLKYSCCLWTSETGSLDEAEEAMLRLTCERAGIEPGMEILELGCGWGSLSLWIAEHYPGCRILAVSNSASQREFIEAERDRRGLDGLQVVTADMNDFATERRFDRIVSVEMFEHMRNYEELLRRISTWLLPEGKLFVHIFCHRELAYLYEIDGNNDWMARHFFTGGLMPSDDLLSRFDDVMQVARQWRVDGTHYARTLDSWRRRMDERRDDVLRLFREVYGPSRAKQWFHRWRIFFLACEELFGFRGGEEWWVSHYLLEPRRAS